MSGTIFNLIAVQVGELAREIDLQIICLGLGICFY